MTLDVQREAVALWDVRNYVSGSVANEGTGGSALALTFPGGTNNPTYLAYAGTNYAYLPGIAGNYCSTPDSAAVSITGDIDLRMDAALAVWTLPTTQQFLISKIPGGDPNRDFGFSVLTTGKLRLQWSPDGTAASQLVKDSTVALTAAALSRLQTRVTLDVDNGAAGNDVKFWTRAIALGLPLTDHTNWTQLGATVTTAGTTSIHNGTGALEVGTVQTGATPMTGTAFRACAYDGIDGTLVADYDPSRSVEPHSTFTASTGEVWTHNRASSGRKLVLVDRPLLLFGTDDYLSVADNDLLDFAAADSFTVVAAYRVYGTSTTQAVVAKRANDTANTVGWKLDRGTTANTPLFLIDDGTANPSDAGAALTQGVASVVSGVRGVTADNIQTYSNTTAGSATTDTTTGTLANATAFRIGADAGGRYADMAFFGAAIFRRVLTAAEIADVNTYFLTAAYTLSDGFGANVRPTQPGQPTRRRKKLRWYLTLGYRAEMKLPVVEYLPTRSGYTATMRAIHGESGAVEYHRQLRRMLEHDTPMETRAGNATIYNEEQRLAADAQLIAAAMAYLSKN